jgi:hypothetical protein
LCFFLCVFFKLCVCFILTGKGNIGRKTMENYSWQMTSMKNLFRSKSL